MFTNVFNAHNEDICKMLEDLKSSIEIYNEKIGKQRIQRHNAVKIGFILHLITEIEFTEWTEYLLKELKMKLGLNVMLVLIATMINDGTKFKDGKSTRKKVFAPRKKVGNMGVHVETIKSQQLQFKRALEKILTKIPAKRYGMELRLMPQLRYDVDTRQKTRLRNTMVRNKHALENFCEINALEFDDICTPISALDGKTLRILIMDLQETGEDFFCDGTLVVRRMDIMG